MTPSTRTTFDPEMKPSTYDAAASALERATTRTRETAEDTVDLIRRNPGKTIAVALVAGAALGAWMVNALAEDAPESRWEKISEVARTNWPAAGQEAWQRLRSGLEDAARSVQEAIESAARRFR
jgi:hypothetical protein